MPSAHATFSPVEELRSMLDDLPLDKEQRESVSAGLESLPTGQVQALLADLRATFRNLEYTLRELDELMAASTVNVSSDKTLGQVFEHSAC